MVNRPEPCFYNYSELYADKGVKGLENTKVLKLSQFGKIGTPVEIINGLFGGKEGYNTAIRELENELFNDKTTA